MTTHKKRRSKLSKTSSAAQLFQKDEAELRKYYLEKGGTMAEALREAVFDGLKFRRLLAGAPDKDEVDKLGRPVKLPDLTLDTLNDAIQARLNGIEETLKGVLPEARGEAGGSGKEAVAREHGAASRPNSEGVLFEQFFVPLAEQIHFLRLESEFTFRLAYCVRELVKEFLVREKLLPKVPQEGLPGEDTQREAALEKRLAEMMALEVVLVDGEAQKALINIRAGRSPRMVENFPPGDPSSGVEDEPQAGDFDPTRRMFDEIAEEVNFDAVEDRLANQDAVDLDEPQGA